MTELMHHIDLCSGIGGFSLGFQWAGLSKPVLFCDTDAWCRKVLAKHWPDVPIAEDVKELANDPDRLIPRTDPRNTILTSGYPCQPFSQAGARRGTSDSRHIYPYISEIIAHKRPAWVVLENVHGHLSLGLDEVLNDLANQNYAARPFIFPSGAIVGAPHHRKRVWIIARNVGNTAHNGCIGRGEADGREGQTHQPQQQPSVRGKPIRPSEDVADTASIQCDERQYSISAKTAQQKGLRGQTGTSGEDVADTDNEGSQGRLPGRQDTQWQGKHGYARCSGTAHRQPAKDWWATEPDVGRVAHGIPRRVDRLKGLGNAIVPQIAQRIGETIKKAEGL